jgi:hypothetical protein
MYVEVLTSKKLFIYSQDFLHYKLSISYTIASPKKCT